MDYHMLEQYLIGSSIQSQNIYAYNWFWVDIYDNIISKSETEDPPIENLDCGLSLQNTTILWQFNASTNNIANGQSFYVFAITERILNITNDNALLM